MDNLDNTRVISLSDGNNLIITYSEKFYDKVRKYYKLDAEVVPTDDHLRDFFVQFMSAA